MSFIKYHRYDYRCQLQFDLRNIFRHTEWEESNFLLNIKYYNMALNLKRKKSLHGYKTWFIAILDLFVRFAQRPKHWLRWSSQHQSLSISLSLLLLEGWRFYCWEFFGSALQRPSKSPCPTALAGWCHICRKEIECKQFENPQP